MKITLTIDTARIAEFGGSHESLGEFLDRVTFDHATGGKVIWTTTCALVGTIDKVER